MSFSTRYLISKNYYYFSCRKLSTLFSATHSLVDHFKSEKLKCRRKSLCSLKLPSILYTLTQTRNKYSRKSSSEENSDNEDESENFKDERDSKVIKTTVNSLRADLILKAGLGLARNKVEVAFYESRVRVNGQKLSKKSIQLQIGDEIDLIKGFSSANPALLIASKVVILSAKEKDENLTVQLRRYKNLLIENYEGLNTYKSSGS